MDILRLFPTAIGKVSDFITEEERLKLIKSIKNTIHDTHGSITGDGFSTFGMESDLLDNNIRDRLEFQANNYAKTYGITSIELGKVWSNIQNKGSVLEKHSHANCSISGALYINVDDSCSLTFHNPNPYIYFTDISESLININNCQTTAISVYNRDLIFFPSWLMHGTHKVVNQYDNRMVISFNIRS